MLNNDIFTEADFKINTDTSLRPYQEDNKLKIYALWTTLKRVMLQMPTGTGKTRLFVSIVRDVHNWGVKNKKAVKVLILAHRHELIDQICENVGVKYGIAHGVILSNFIEQKQYPTQIASVQTLTRRLDKWTDKGFNIIIIDEAHHVKADSYNKILEEFPDAYVLGVTATPYRLNGAGFRPEFEELIVSPSVKTFIKNKYLSEYEYFSIRPNSIIQSEINNISKFALDGDYLDEAMMDIMDRDYIRAKIIDSYFKIAEGKKGIIYTINRIHNQHICDGFVSRGIKAVAIDAKTPKLERQKNVEDFKAGKIDIICNVNIFSEGFDCPDLEFVQLARPTKSLSMFLQQVGRGLRISAKKEKALFIDNVGLYNRFGLPSATRRWKKHFEGREVDEYEYRGNGQELEINYFDDEIEEGDENIELIHASVNEANNENIMKYKDEYIKYLEYRGYSDATIKMYVSSILKHVDSYITKLIEPNHIHLFDIIETEYIRTLFDNLIDNDTFEFENKLQHNRFSVSFKKYLEFSQDYQKEQPNSELNDNQEEELLLNTPKSPIINTEDELTKTNEMIEFYRERNLPLDKTLLDYKKNWSLS